MKKRAAWKTNKAAWLARGRTRRIIAKVLTTPMDSPAIAKAAARFVPKIERVQTSRVLRQLSSRGIVECLTPKIRGGRIYCLTRGGRRIIASVFGAKRQSIPKGIDWYVYSRVYRNRVMRRILDYLKNVRHKGPQEVGQVRHLLFTDRILSYTQLYRSLDYLAACWLVKYCGSSLLNGHRLYLITEAGRRVAEVLARER